MNARPKFLRKLVEGRRAVGSLFLTIIGLIGVYLLVSAQQAQIPELAMTLESNQSNGVVSISPDEKIVVIADNSNTNNYVLNLWDTSSSEKVRQLSYESPLHSVAFSPDGRFLVTGHFGGTGRVKNASSGEDVLQFQHEIHSVVTNVAYSPDGTLIASNSPWEAYLWDVVTGKPARRFEIEGDSPALAFNSNGRFLATAVSSRDHDQSKLCIWNIVESLEIECTQLRGAIFDLAWSPGEDSIVLASNSSAIIWEPFNKSEIKDIEYGGRVWTVSYSPDGRFLMLGGDTRPLVIWDTQTWERAASFGDCGKAPCVFSEAAFAPSGALVWAYKADRDGSFVELWNLLNLYQ